MFESPMIKKVFPILGLSIFSSLLGAGIVVPLLPLYAESLGASGIWLGIIFAVFSMSQSISTPVFGRLSDRTGRKKLLAIGLLAYTAASLSFVWAGNVFQLTLVRFLQGAAGGMVVPIAQAYIGDICPEGEEGRWMGYANAAFFTGFGCGPLMGGTLAAHFGMDAAFYSMTGLNLLAFLIVVAFLPGVSNRKTASNPELSFRMTSSSKMIRGLFSFQLSFALGRAAFMVFLPIFAASRLNLSTDSTGVLLAANILLISLFGVPSGRLLADRFDRKALVVLGCIIYVVSIVLIPPAQNFWQLLSLCILGGLGGAISMPAASALAVGEGRKFGMGSVIALMSMAFSLGMSIGPILSGTISDFVGIDTVFYLGGAMVFLGASLFLWFAR